MSEDHPKPASEETARVVEDALFKLWEVVNDISHIPLPRPAHYRVSIFGSARLRPGSPQYEQVKELAARLTRAGCEIITGGGPGLMQAANEGAALGDPHDVRTSYGIRVALPFEKAANPYVERDFVHRTFFSRLHHFARLSDAFIVADGGIGTLLEAAMIWQLLQVRHMKEVPLIFFGPMWEGLVRWAKESMLPHDPPLANDEDLAIPVCLSTIDQVMEEIERHRNR